MPKRDSENIVPIPYDVILTKTAAKSYGKLPSKLQDGIDRCLIWLEGNPKHGPNIKRLWKVNPDIAAFM